MRRWWRRWRGRQWVHPTTHEICKFMPHNPPQRGDVVLVDGERCRVVRSVIRWNGLHWTLDGVRVEPA